MGLVSRVERNVAAKDTSAVILESLVGWFCSTARLKYRWRVVEWRRVTRFFFWVLKGL